MLILVLILVSLILLVLILISLILISLVLVSLVLLVLILITLVLHVGLILILILPLATALGRSALDIARRRARSINGGRYRLVRGLGKHVKGPHFASIIRTYFLQVFLHHLLAFWDLVLAFRTKSESGP